MRIYHIVLLTINAMLFGSWIGGWAKESIYGLYHLDWWVIFPLLNVVGLISCIILIIE